MPSISVITTAYNVGKYLARTIDSVLAQTLSDFEYLIVDDVSTDDSLAIANAKAAADARIRIIAHERNLGAGPARNTALAHAHGDYVAFLDGDDVWDPKFLARNRDVLVGQSDDCAGVFCWSRLIDETDAPNGDVQNPPGGDYDLFRMLKGICPPGNGSSLLLRREGFREVGDFTELKTGEDLEMWCRLVHASSRKRMFCNPEVLVDHRVRRGSLMTKFHPERIASAEYSLEKYLPSIPKERRWEILSAYADFSPHLGDWYLPWATDLSRRAVKAGFPHLLASGALGYKMLFYSAVGFENYLPLKRRARAFAKRWLAR